MDLQLFFDRLVDITEPICQEIDSVRASMSIYDSSGIEAFVAENNPKYANRIIKQLKSYAKVAGYDKNYDPYKAAYRLMPSCASANPQIKQLLLTAISAMFSNLASLPMALVSLGYILYNEDFFKNHLTLSSVKNLIHQMRINPYMMLVYSYQF